MPEPTPEGRTHTTRMVQATGADAYWLECRGCGERWPYDMDRATIERQPCGTREGA